MSKKTVLYFAPSPATFVQKDIDLLVDKYDVKFADHNWLVKRRLFITIFKQFFFLLKNGWSASHIIVMFGGYWSFFPALFGKIFRKPVYIILGGTDCVSFPSIYYGSLRKPIQKRFIKWSYKMCKELLPVDDSLVFSDYHYFEQAVHKTQGFKAFFPNIKTNYTTIYNGFDTKLFNPPTVQKKQNSFITVADISDKKRYMLKGIDICLEVAKEYPDSSFTIIGMNDTFKKTLKDVPANVNIYPLMNSATFLEHLSKSQFYLQLSISEGFPNALCEGMLCKCIPIGSSVGAVPFIIKDTGFILDKRSKKEWKPLFDTVFKTDPKELTRLSELSRKRIVENFDISKRQKAFFTILDKYEN